MNTCQSVTISDKKKFLFRYRKNRALLNRLADKYINVCDSFSAKSPKISDMPKGSSGVTMSDKVLEKIELEERINKIKERGLQIKKEIVEAIDTLEDSVHADVLERYFIDGQEFYEIAEDLGYTMRHVKRIYHEAIECIIISL